MRAIVSRLAELHGGMPVDRCRRFATCPPRPKTPPIAGRSIGCDCVALEVALVKVPESWDEDDRLWQEVDEQHLATDVRRRLQDNGLRTGILGTQIPEVLRTSLEQSTDPLESLTSEGSPEEGDLFSKKRRLHIRPGSPRRIPVTTTGENASVVLYTEEATVARAVRETGGHAGT